MHWKSALKIGLIAVVFVAAARYVFNRFGLPGADLL